MPTRPSRLGLALSGGGYRAAAFHLGVFEELDRQGLLSQVKVFSSVSGGSILLGCYAIHSGQLADFVSNCFRLLNSVSIDVEAVLGGVFDPFRNSTDFVIEKYEQHFFHGKKLADINQGQDHPKFIWNATNLSNGKNWKFTFNVDPRYPPGWVMGDYDYGFFRAANFPLAKAVMASSAFPVAFDPVKLSRDEYSPQGLPADVRYVTLGDGGIYDNLGVSALFAEKCDYILVSDAGAPFADAPEPTTHATMVYRRATDVMMEKMRSLEFDKLSLLYKFAPEVADEYPDFKKAIWFSIDSWLKDRQGNPKEMPPEVQKLSSIPTRLRELEHEKIVALKNHAAQLMHRRLTQYASELLPT